MKQYLKPFLMFVAMGVVLKKVVVPIAQKANVPLIKDL